MAEITLRVPDALASLPPDEQDALLRAGLYEATEARIRQLEADLEEARAQVSAFEERYGMSLERFEQEGMQALDSFQDHDAYNDWTFWNSVAHQTRELLTTYRRLTPP